MFTSTLEKTGGGTDVYMSKERNLSILLVLFGFHIRFSHFFLLFFTSSLSLVS